MIESSEQTQPKYWRSVLYGAIINNLVSIVPILQLSNALGGVGLMLAGGFAVYHFIQTKKVYTTLGVSFQIGAFAGLLGCLFWFIHFILFGGMFISLLQIIFAAIVISGLSGVISGSVIRRKYASPKKPNEPMSS